jgi:DNA repair exonuclease SbcCD nuclease subunit
MKKLSVKALIIIFAGVIVLAISAALSVWLITAPDLKITVMSDPHMLVEEQIASYGSAAYQDQDADAQKMINISEAIIKTAIDDFIRSDSDILIVPGDITQDSSVISHTAFEAEIRRAEDAGKQVYIMPGNHDINHGSSMFGTETEQEIESISADDFTKLYSDYGYSEAVSRDPLTLSYAVDINKKYRLISIDTAYHPGFSPISFEGIKRNDSDLTPELTSWTINELNKAYSEGMTPIAMTHFPVVNHLGASVGSLSLAESSAVNGAAEFAEALADAGLKYLFTGHMHTQDIISYTSASGKYAVRYRNGQSYELSLPCQNSDLL